MASKGNKIKIGVLGCADIAKRSFIPAIKELETLFDLVAVSSRTIKKANELASEFNCQAIEGYEELINLPDLDAIYIPLPTGLHKEWINKALSNGLHVYSEKSISMSTFDSEVMINNASSNSLALMEGYMFLYHNQHKIVKGLIHKGKIGHIRFFQSSFGFPPLKQNNFRYNLDIGGGALIDIAGYPLRAAHFILNKNLRVRAASVHFDPISKTSIWGSAFLSDKSGLGASIAFGFDNYYQCNYEIWGSKGKIIVKKAFTPLSDFTPEIILVKDDQNTKIQSKAENHFTKALEEFHRIISNPSLREKHFQGILLQSSSQELIRNMALGTFQEY